MDSNRNVEMTTRFRELEQKLISLRNSLDHERESPERVQAALRESEQRFEMIAEYGPWLVWTTRVE